MMARSGSPRPGVGGRWLFDRVDFRHFVAKRHRVAGRRLAAGAVVADGVMDRAVARAEEVQNDNDANVDQAAQRTITANGRTLASNEHLLTAVVVTGACRGRCPAYWSVCSAAGPAGMLQ